MKAESGIKFVGEYEILIKYKNVEKCRKIKNVITDLGMNEIGKLILGRPDAQKFFYLGIGGGDSPATFNDVSLDSEFAYGTYERKEPTEDNITSIIPGEKNVNLRWFFNRFEGFEGSGSEWKELGVFLEDSGNNCVSRVVISYPFVKSDINTVVVTWRLNIKGVPDE